MADRRKPDPKPDQPAEKLKRRLSIPSTRASIGVAMVALVLIVAGAFWLFGWGGDPTVRGVAGAVPESGMSNESVSSGSEGEADAVIEAFQADAGSEEKLD